MEKKLIAAMALTMFTGPALANMSFSDMDTDKDGSISKAEYDAGLKTKGSDRSMSGSSSGAMDSGSVSDSATGGSSTATDDAMSVGTAGGADSSNTSGSAGSSMSGGTYTP